MFALFLTFRARIGPQDLQFFRILETGKWAHVKRTLETG